MKLTRYRQIIVTQFPGFASFGMAAWRITFSTSCPPIFQDLTIWIFWRTLRVNLFVQPSWRLRGRTSTLVAKKKSNAVLIDLSGKTPLRQPLYKIGFYHPERVLFSASPCAFPVHVHFNESGLIQTFRHGPQK
jgi:hypothetical protein